MSVMQTQKDSKQTGVVDQDQWLALRSNHVARLSPVVNAHRMRAIEGRKHPVVDFLFEYYHFRPAKLLDWSPGIGTILTGHKALSYLSQKQYTRSGSGVSVNPASFPVNRRTGLNWVINLLQATQHRKPFFGCFGLHEWCMVYDKSDIRHRDLPLRLSHSQIREVVEQGPVLCSHYDAFRFYSDSAKKFNRHQPNREDMAGLEQPGCLHTNMDLYRWAYKFHPWLNSGLIADAFLLALEIRQTDMRASPYNISDYTDLPAIEIETRNGKEEYANLQRDYYHKARAVRETLIAELNTLRASTRN